METAALTIDPKTARELWRAYKRDQHWEGPIDAEIRSAYQKLAQGKLVIQAIKSVVDAGLGADGLPKLALARADADRCQLRARRDGSAEMESVTRRRQAKRSRSLISFAEGSFPFREELFQKQGYRFLDKDALLPLVPIHLRPKRAMSNYHILWEAEWRRAAPVDPILLRRLGKGDLWVVLAVWELTEVERAALTARLPS